MGRVILILSGIGFITLATPKSGVRSGLLIATGTILIYTSFLSRPKKVDVRELVACKCGVVLHFELAKNAQWRLGPRPWRVECPVCKAVLWENSAGGGKGG